MKLRVLFFLCLFFSTHAFAQEKEFIQGGKPFATIFANFHKGITGSAVDKAAFELVRAYIGYEYSISPEFYAKINVDIGSPNDLSPYSKLRRYAYFKNAFLRYTKNKIKIEFGLISTKQFKLQEKIWERRYLMKSFADEYRLGTSADLGVNINYKFSEAIDADFSITNGEGYNNIQTNDIFKYSLGTTIRFPENITSRVYYDLSHDNIIESTISFFTSYDYNKKWNIAGEVLFRQNKNWVDNHDIFGISIFGKYNITNQYQLFARYDKIESNKVNGSINPWNLSNDGSAIVAGVQFKPIKNIKIALNYHDWYPWAANQENEAFIYLNLEVKI